MVERRTEPRAPQGSNFQWLGGLDRSRPRGVVEDRQLPEELPGKQFRNGLRCLSFEDQGSALDDKVDLIAGVALAKDIGPAAKCSIA